MQSSPVESRLFATWRRHGGMVDWVRAFVADEFQSGAGIAKLYRTLGCSGTCRLEEVRVT